MPKSHYDILQIRQDASVEVLKAARNILSAKYHPDKNPSPEATEHFNSIQEAYDVLSDPQRRAQYDNELRASAKSCEAPEAEQASRGRPTESRTQSSHRESCEAEQTSRGPSSQQQRSKTSVRDINSQLADAKREAQCRLEDWQRYKSRKVFDFELTLLRQQIDGNSKQLEPFESDFRNGRMPQKIEAARKRLSEADGSFHALIDADYSSRNRWLRFHSKRTFYSRLFSDDSIGWLPGALFIATPRFAFAVPLMIYFASSYWWIFGVAGFLFVTTFLWSAWVLRDLDRSEYRNNPTELRDWVAHRKAQIHTASDEFANAKCEFMKLDSIQKLHDLYSAAQTDLPRLEAIRACQRAYEAAIAEVRRLELLQESR